MKIIHVRKPCMSCFPGSRRTTMIHRRSHSCAEQHISACTYASNEFTQNVANIKLTLTHTFACPSRSKKSDQYPRERSFANQYFEYIMFPSKTVHMHMYIGAHAKTFCTSKQMGETWITNTDIAIVIYNGCIPAGPAQVSTSERKALIQEGWYTLFHVISNET